MPLDWINGEGINPNTLRLPVFGDEIAAKASTVVGDTVTAVATTFAGLPSIDELGMPRQGGG